MKSASAPPSPASSAAGNAGWLAIAVGGLLGWRWMAPAESASQGETLWIAQGWFFLFVLWSLNRLRERAGEPFSRDRRIELTVWLLVGAHWLATLALWFQGGDRRTALNLCWEWTALGVSFVFLRRALRQGGDRTALLRLVFQIGIGFAALGLWQHFIEYPAIYREYEPLAAAQDALIDKSRTEQLSTDELRKLAELRLQLQEFSVPSEPIPRMMFEHRLRETREPIARWALTNSLAGWLAVCLTGGLLFAFAHRRRLGMSGLSASTCLLLPLAVCLWLTHCRTALVAVAGGIGLGIAWPAFGRTRVARGMLLLLPAAAVIATVLVVVAIGRFPQFEPHPEIASKSLRYRAQYLVATSHLLSDRWLNGVGPGNFRQHYVHEKLPEASEEIVDPHNFLFDLWASGGIAALLAGALVVSCAISRQLSPARQAGTAASDRPSPPIWTFSGWHRGACLALGLLFLFSLMITDFPEWDLLALAVALPVTDWLCVRGLGLADLAPGAIRLGCGCGAAVMFIHLLGAGGIEMPAIVQLLLVLAAVSLSTVADETPDVERSPIVVVGTAAAAAALFLGCFLTATQPVVSAGVSVERARALLSARPGSPAARRDFEAAIAADPIWPEPWRELAFFELSNWLQDPDDETRFRRGELALREAKARDPWNYTDDRRLAEACFRRFQDSDEARWATKAAEGYERALQRYPTHPQMLAEFAIAADAAGFPEKSADAAKKAITYDDENRKQEHWEKVQPPEMRRRLEELARNP